ncbi:MAG: peptidyl-prolyl cis-trans isomerase [Acidobacteria bacterium]|nr:peptidyl-prolyl cis-trans isomerase [Acidobacteriota bacterium]
MNRRAALSVVLLAALASVPTGAEIIEQVLVNVNGDILTKTEFEQRQVAVLRTRPELGNVTPDSPELKRAIGEVTPQLILDAVDELLLIQRGRELGLALGDEQFNSIVENIKKSNNLEDEAQFQAALKQEGMTMADLRRSLERQMLASEAQRRDVVDKISVTEAEAQAYYKAHKQEFTTPSEITLREILVEVPVSDRGVNVAEDDAARAETEEIRKRLLAAEPFARLAAEVSDAPSKANGGLIGPINREELAEGLKAQLDRMKVGDLTEVMRTPRGYQILKLESRSETKIRTFDEARGDISNKVGESKMTGERLKYLERLRAQATITWRNDELKRAYEQALAARQKALAG